MFLDPLAEFAMFKFCLVLCEEMPAANCVLHGGLGRLTRKPVLDVDLDFGGEHWQRRRDVACTDEVVLDFV
jgi:hypothetical protein